MSNLTDYITVENGKFITHPSWDGMYAPYPPEDVDEREYVHDIEARITNYKLALQAVNAMIGNEKAC